MKVAIIGDYNDNYRPHRATNEAVDHAVEKFSLDLETKWIPTDTIEVNFAEITKKYSGFWIAPGSPYKSMAGVLRLIKYARQNNIPTLGTCGGFQHMAIEFVRGVMGITDSQHAEYDPYASKLVINPLSCSLAGQTLEIEITDKTSKTFSIFEAEKIYEKYYCNFGLNPEYQTQLNDSGFKIVGTDSFNEARILELFNHKFFIATLFVPQDNSAKDRPHKLVSAFLKSIFSQEKLTSGL